MPKNTIILGASANPSRYAYLATERLLHHGHPLVLIGKREENVLGQIIRTEFPLVKNTVDTISLYLNPSRQKEYEERIVQLAPKRVIFNPGTENAALQQKLQENGIEVVEACTLVLLATKQY